ncbi:MAG: trypsin-like serine protease [Acidimicrobiales bacterium]
MRTRTLTAIAATCATIAATLALAAPPAAADAFTTAQVWENDVTVGFNGQPGSGSFIEARPIGTNAPASRSATGRRIPLPQAADSFGERLGAAERAAVALIRPGTASIADRHYCDGVLVSARHVLTTAGCARRHANPTVVSATERFDGAIDERNIARVLAIEIAPGNGGDPNDANHAVITLDRAVDPSGYVAVLETPGEERHSCAELCPGFDAFPAIITTWATPGSERQAFRTQRLDWLAVEQNDACALAWGSIYDSTRHSCTRLSTHAQDENIDATCPNVAGAGVWVNAGASPQLIGLIGEDDRTCGVTTIENVAPATTDNASTPADWIREVIGVGEWRSVANRDSSCAGRCSVTIEDLDIGAWHIRVRYDSEFTIDKGTSAIVEWAPRPPVGPGLGGARNDCDSDGDGIDELVIGSGNATVAIDADGSARHRGRARAVACGDLDGDGIDDLVVVTTTRTRTVITTHFADRTVRTGIAGGGGVRGEVTAVIANANRRPGKELIIGQPDAGNGRVTVWTSRGGGLRRLATLTAPRGADGFGRAIAVGNVLGNRQAELVVAADAAVTIHPTRRNAPRARPMRTIDMAGVATLAIGNVDRDRANEIVAGTPAVGQRNGGAVAVIEPRRPRAGRTLDATDATTAARPGERLGQSIVLADTDGDGIDDIIAGGNRGRIFRFDGADAIIIDTPGRPRGFGRLVAAADTDDDGADELVTTQRRGRRTVVIALDGLDSTPQRSIVTRIAGRVHLLY